MLLLQSGVSVIMLVVAPSRMDYGIAGNLGPATAERRGLFFGYSARMNLSVRFLATMLHTANTTIAPTTAPMRPAPSPGPYQPRA